MNEKVRFDISMKNSILVHVVNRFEDLVHKELHSIFRKVVSASFYRFVHIHIHELEYQSKTTSWLITIRNITKCTSTY